VASLLSLNNSGTFYFCFRIKKYPMNPNNTSAPRTKMGFHLLILLANSKEISSNSTGSDICGNGMNLYSKNRKYGVFFSLTYHILYESDLLCWFVPTRKKPAIQFILKYLYFYLSLYSCSDLRVGIISPPVNKGTYDLNLNSPLLEAWEEFKLWIKVL